MDDTNRTNSTSAAPSASGDYVAVEIPCPGTDDGVAVVAVRRGVAEDPEQRAAMIASMTEMVRKVFPDLAGSGGQQGARSGEALRHLRVVPQDGDHDDVS